MFSKQHGPLTHNIRMQDEDAQVLEQRGRLQKTAIRIGAANQKNFFIFLNCYLDQLKATSEDLRESLRRDIESIFQETLFHTGCPILITGDFQLPPSKAPWIFQIAQAYGFIEAAELYNAGKTEWNENRLQYMFVNQLALDCLIKFEVGEEGEVPKPQSVAGQF